MALPIARLGDKAYFPGHGSFPIAEGDPLFLDSGRPVARVGDKILCPGPGIIIEGSFTLLDKGIPVARILDKVYSPAFGLGFIVSGSSHFLEG